MNRQKCNIDKLDLNDDNNITKECILPVYLENVKVNALIDSGCTHCIIGEKLFNLVPELKSKLEKLKLPTEATAVNGSKIRYPAKISLDIKLEQYEGRINAYYSPILDYELVLGYNFLKSAGLKVDFKNMKISKPKTIVVRMPKDNWLEPETETIVYGYVKYKQTLGEAIISPHAAVQNLGLLVARGLVDIDSDKPYIPLRIFNPLPFGVKINAGTRLATVERLSLVDKISDPLNYCSEVANTTTLDDKQCKKKVKFKPPDDFTQLFDLSKSTFNEDQKSELMDLLWEYEDIFARKGKPLGCTNLIEFEMELKEGAKPFRAKPYRSNPKLRKELSDQVQELLKQGIIRPSTSNYCSPVLLVTKPDGSYRAVIDYRRQNQQVVLDNFPMNNITDSLQAIGTKEGRIFSTLDLQQGYYQIPVREECRKYTGFITHDGIYEFCRLPFGLANSPSCFNRLMAKVLAGLTWDIALVYLDDVICFSKDFPDHLAFLRAIFQRLREAHLTLKPSKCTFGREKINFLGHEVSKDGISPLKEKCKAVLDFPKPKKVKEVRAFLGLSGYYRKHIKSYSKIALPLTELTKNENKFTWTSECEEAFNKLKQALVNPPILAYPVYGKDYILQTDASGEAIGLVLGQIQNGKQVVISYGGKKLTNSEKKFSTTERECLAVVVGLKQFEPYLRGTHVKIQTDHSALKWILTQKQPQGRLARWLAFLQTFDYEVEHRAGIRMGNADGLSRREYNDGIEETQDQASPQPSESLTNSGVPQALSSVDKELDEKIFPELVNAANVQFHGRRVTLKGKKTIPKPAPQYIYPNIEWSPEKVRDCQLKDDKIRPIIQYLENGSLPKEDQPARRIVLSSEAYIIENGVLYRILDTKAREISKQTEEIYVCLVVPNELKFDVLTSAHGDLSAGHYGSQRTYTTLRIKYFWEGMWRDCRNFVLSCEKCSTKKNPVRPVKAELQPLPPAFTNQRWAMDIVHMPKTARGNKYMLTFTEYSTRYVDAHPLTNTQAITIARIVVDELCFRFGCPQEILSDLGQNLIGQVMTETCKLLGVKRLYTSPYHPATDGLLEKFHSTLCKNLAMYVSTDHLDWDLYVKAIVYGYNTSVCIDSTQYTPFFLMYGREPYCPLDSVLPTVQDAVPPSVKEFVLRLQKAREVARINITESQARMKKRYDESANSPPFAEGDMVWIYFPEINLLGSRKFFHNYSGPYLLSKKLGDTNFSVVQAHDLKPLKNPIHVNRLKRFHHRSVVPPSPERIQQLGVTQAEEVHDVADLHPHDQLQVLKVHQAQSSPLQSVSNPAIVPQQSVSTLPRDIEIHDPPVERTDNIEPTTEQEPEYEINKILRARYNKSGDLEYLIDWKNFGKEARTYEPFENLNETAQEYVKTHKIPVVNKSPVLK